MILERETSDDVKDTMEILIRWIVSSRASLGHILDPFYTIFSTQRINS